MMCVEGEGRKMRALPPISVVLRERDEALVSGWEVVSIMGVPSKIVFLIGFVELSGDFGVPLLWLEVVREAVDWMGCRRRSLLLEVGVGLLRGFEEVGVPEERGEEDGIVASTIRRSSFLKVWMVLIFRPSSI